MSEYTIDATQEMEPWHSSSAAKLDAKAKSFLTLDRREGTTYIVMYEISLFYVQVLEIVISAPQPSNVRTKSRRLFMKAEHSLDIISPLALGQSSP